MSSFFAPLLISGTNSLIRRPSPLNSGHLATLSRLPLSELALGTRTIFEIWVDGADEEIGQRRCHDDLEHNPPFLQLPSCSFPFSPLLPPLYKTTRRRTGVLQRDAQPPIPSPDECTVCPHKASKRWQPSKDRCSRTTKVDGRKGEVQESAV